MVVRRRWQEAGFHLFCLNILRPTASSSHVWRARSRAEQRHHVRTARVTSIKQPTRKKQNKTIKSEAHIHLARVILSLGLAPGHLEVANGSIYTYVCVYVVTVVRRHPRRKPSQADSLEFLTTACLNLLGLSQTLTPHTCPFHEDFSVAVACSRLHSSFSLPSLITITLVCAS